MQPKTIMIKQGCPCIIIKAMPIGTVTEYKQWATQKVFIKY